MVNRMLFLPEAAVFPDAILVSLSPGKGSEFYPALTGWRTSTSRIQNGYKACKRGMEKWPRLSFHFTPSSWPKLSLSIDQREKLHVPVEDTLIYKGVAASHEAFRENPSG